MFYVKHILLIQMKPMMEKMEVGEGEKRNYLWIRGLGFVDSKQAKAKRVRTTFTEEQLQILQANFEVDSNPDGQDLERIAQITGTKKFGKIFLNENLHHWQGIHSQ